MLSLFVIIIMLVPIWWFVSLILESVYDGKSVGINGPCGLRLVLFFLLQTSALIHFLGLLLFKALYAFPHEIYFVIVYHCWVIPV